jgi:hypothetical protein
LTHLEISVEGDSLLVKVTPQPGFPRKDSPPPPAPPPMHLGFTGEDRLLVLDGPQKGGRVEVMREQGRVAWLHMGGRMHKRQP